MGRPPKGRVSQKTCLNIDLTIAEFLKKELFSGRLTDGMDGDVPRGAGRIRNTLYSWKIRDPESIFY